MKVRPLGRQRPHELTVRLAEGNRVIDGPAAALAAHARVRLREPAPALPEPALTPASAP